MAFEINKEVLSPVLRSIRMHKFAYTLVAVVLYQLLCAIQGFDLSDEGWGMYFYQQIFKNPECVGGHMAYWVTGVIGGFWNLLFPWSGFLGTRIFGIIIVTYTFYLSYTFLKQFIKTDWVLVGLVVQVLIVAGDPKPFGYNTLTALFVLWAVIAFYRGLENNKLIWLFIGGLLLGINIFVRIPNLAILPILLLIPMYMYWKYGRFTIFSRQLWLSVLGAVVGATFIIVVMYFGGYWAYFMDSLGGIADTAKDPDNSHQLGRLIVRYLQNYLGIAVVGAIVTSIGCVYILLNREKNRIWNYALVLLVICSLSFLSIHYNTLLRFNDMYFAHFISYAGGILILVCNFRNGSYKLNYIALASLLMIICIPLGSDLGIHTMWTSAWLALPLGTAYLYEKLRNEKLYLYWKRKKILLCNKTAIQYLILLFSVSIACGIYKNENFAYYDLGSRFEKVHSINNPYCRFIYANSYRADLMNELLPVLQNYVKPNDYLLVYNFMPGLNYMTDTRSYTSNSWLWCLSGSELQRQLDISIAQGKPLPVVLRQHFTATNRWQEYDPEFADENRNPVNGLSRNDQTKTINDFLRDNHYRTVWTNKNFEILLPGI